MFVEHEHIPKECTPDTMRGSGGSFLAQGGKFSKKQISEAAIIMDEIGWKSPKLETPTVNLESYDWAAPVLQALVSSNKDHNGDKLRVVHSSNPFGSDHMSFLKHKMP